MNTASTETQDTKAQDPYELLVEKLDDRNLIGQAAELCMEIQELAKTMKITTPVNMTTLLEKALAHWLWLHGIDPNQSNTYRPGRIAKYHDMMRAKGLM
jgi:hypothetical protein